MAGEEYKWSAGDLLHPRNSNPLRVLERMKGGFGAVYICQEQHGGRRVAVKTVIEDHLRDESRYKNFIHEAHLWVRLGRHPNIVAVEMIDTIDGRLCLLLEYAECGSLASLLQRGIPASRSLEIASDCACGMSYLWRTQRIVHRDLKPANLLLTGSGQLKVTDFGLAHALGKAGTKLYMAPEQRASVILDTRCDIYSFGVVLLEMFGGSQFVVALQNGWQTAQDLVESILGAPPGIRQLIHDCLQTAPANRPRDFDEVLVRLRTCGARTRSEKPHSGDWRDASTRLGSAFALAEQGVNLANLGRLPEALEYYDRALSLNDEFQVSETWKNRATALLGLHRYEEALASSQRALDLLAEDAALLDSETIRSIRQKAWTNKTAALAGLHRHEEALAACEEALRLDPEYPRLWNNKGSNLVKLDRLDEALACIHRALEIDDRYEKAWHNKGDIHLQRGELTEALAAYQHLTGLNPRNSAALIGLIQCAAMAGKVEGMEDRLRELERMDPGAYRQLLEAYQGALPENPVDPRSAADLCLQTGDYGRAIKFYEQALSMSPMDADLWNNKGGIPGLKWVGDDGATILGCRIENCIGGFWGSKLRGL